MSVLLLSHSHPSSCVGTLAWIEKLEWSGLKEFMKAARTPLYPPSGVKTRNTGAFLQQYENFSLYWILKSGHMVIFSGMCIRPIYKFLQ